MVVFLFVLAVFDLYVGVSNDAVNFMNSAIGSKAARFRTVVIVASVGVLCGAIMSNGMMDIARHGIFRPEMFSFEDVMVIYLAVMVTDIVLLDVFNSLGMPTSTTVSMVFELLGAAFAFALIKVMGGDGAMFGDYLNSEKALSVILAIFTSVAIAFVFGSLIQYIARIIFTFNYKVNLKYKIGIFGGIAVTSIIYFMLFKGMKDLSFMSPDVIAAINENTVVILMGCFVFFAVLMQLLHSMGVNVLKVIVMLGTFSLAMAFAGNDLVNFIGVPLAGYSSYCDFTASGATDPTSFMMDSLNGSAKTPLIFLVAAGAVMVFSLATSKKARHVTDTEVNLSRQNEGDEMFGSSRAARSIVRGANTVGSFMLRITPVSMQRYIDSRFQRPVAAAGSNAAAYDLIRASVNLVVSALLIALGTSLKLPLSTTYVTFMVAMGSSLADRAWSRESAVFRITGVLTVIGGWFITGGVAFAACFFVALAMKFGGVIVMAAIVAIGIFALIRSNARFVHNAKEKNGDELFNRMLSTTDSAEVVKLFREHIGKNVSEVIDKYSDSLIDSTEGLFSEDLHRLRKNRSNLRGFKYTLKTLRRREIICLRRTDPAVMVRVSTPFHLVHNSLYQMYYSLVRIADPALEHVDNNFSPVDHTDAEYVRYLRGKLVILMNETAGNFAALNLADGDEIRAECKALRNEISEFRNKIMVEIQTHDKNITSTTLVLHMLQEIEQIAVETRRIIMEMRKFAELT